MVNLYLITKSGIIQNFLKQLLSVICVTCFFCLFCFALMVDCILSVTGTGMLLFFVVEGGLISY
jgi:hypothetical protein